MTQVYLGDDKTGVMIRPSSTQVTIVPRLKEVVPRVPRLKEVVPCVRPRLREIIDDKVESNKIEKALQEIHAKTITDYKLKYVSIVAQ